MNNNKDDVSWFVLYCRKGREEKVLQALQRKFDSERFTPFIPTWIKPFSGTGAERIGKMGAAKPCFEGYVFLQVQKAGGDMGEIRKSIIHEAVSIDRALFFLYNGDRDDIEMRSDERKLLQRLMNKDFCIESSVGYKEGGRIKVVSGPLVGYEDYIVAADIHRRWVILDMSFVSYVESDWKQRLGFEYVGNTNRDRLAKMAIDSEVENR